jgi:hypothetical protein
MATPEGARKAGSFIAVSDSPDPCRTPPNNVPVPYMVMADLGPSLSVSPNVKFGGHPAVLADESSIGQVTGDEAGTGGGVKSGCHRGEVRFTGGSPSVKINGKRVVRDKDAVTMNKGNTTGQVQCLMAAAPCGGIDGQGRPGAEPRDDADARGGAHV